MASNTFLRCRLTKSAFSGERVFRVTAKQIDEYVGVAPLSYCYDETRNQLRQDQPQNDAMHGHVSAQMISNGAEWAKVLVPDGESIQVPVDLLSY